MTALCICDLHGEMRPPATQEDLLCDYCRKKNFCRTELGMSPWNTDWGRSPDGDLVSRADPGREL